jgi:hypothetical protein
MYNSIIIASALFGTVYLSSISLCLINNALLENKPNKNLLVLNSCTFIVTGSIFLYTITSQKCTY